VAHPALRLLHITDTHLFAGTDGRLRGVDTYRSLGAVLRAVAAGSRQPDAVLATGDLSQDETPAAYRHFRALTAPLGVPVWCLPGNHDAPEPMGEELATAPFRVGGAVRAGAWSLLLLDSFIPGDHGGRLSAAQLDWLATALEEHRERHVLVALHHHALPLQSRWLDELCLYNADALLALVDRAPQVRAVVAGHVHQASDIDRKGVRFLTTPSTCFQFLPRVDSFAIDTRPPGFRWLDLLPDGRIDTDVVWIDPPQ
jgi:Icc protein